MLLDWHIILYFCIEPHYTRMKAYSKIAVILLAAILAASCGTKIRTIKEVSEIIVQTPQGTAPRLPWQVWVKYSDGSGEWRQAKWTNTLRETEEEIGVKLDKNSLVFRSFLLILL